MQFKNLLKFFEFVKTHLFFVKKQLGLASAGSKLLGRNVNSIQPQDKQAGLLVPVFTLRRDGDWGIGDTKCVREALQFCDHLGFRVLQLLPINETGADHSPYNAISSVALDPVYIAMEVESVPGLNSKILKSAVEAEDFESLNRDSVRYFRVKGLKQSVLFECFESFLKKGKKAEFDQFQKKESAWLQSYSLFRTLIDFYEGNVVWTSWKQEHQNQERAERWLEEGEDSEFWKHRRLFHCYVQWVAWSQWHAVRADADRLKIQIMGDIPFGVSRFSADVWARQELFNLQWSGGAPPETFFKSDRFTEQWGQNWGIPLYDWKAHEKENYAWWRQRVQKTCEVFQLFRIDHVLGFYRIYAFPWSPDQNQKFVDKTESEAQKMTGGFLPGFKPASDELPENAAANEREGEKRLKVILEAAQKSGVVAEDLGCVPSYVPKSLRRLGIPGFVIPTFVRDPQTYEFLSTDRYDELSLTTYATHDHSPLRTMFEAMVERWVGPDGHEGWLEMQRLMRWLGENEEKPLNTWTPELHQKWLERLIASPSWLAVFMFSDLMGTTERYNSPGTAADTNWSYRMPRTLKEIEALPQNQRLWSFIRETIQKHHRVLK